MARKRKNTKTQKQNPPIYRQITAAFLFLLSIFIFISLLFDITGPAGKFTENVLKGLFGWASLAIPLIFLYIAIGTSAGGTQTEVKIRIWSGVITIVSFSIILHIFYHTPQSAQGGVIKVIQRLYADGVTLHSGGVIGGALGIPLISIFDKVGTGIIIGFILLISFMLATGITLYQILKVLFPFKFKELAGAVSDRLKKDDPKKGDKNPAAVVAEPPKSTKKEKIQIDIPIVDKAYTNPPQVDDIIDALSLEDDQPIKTSPVAPVKTEEKPEHEFKSVDNPDEKLEEAPVQPPKAYRAPPVSLLSRDVNNQATDTELELRTNAQKLVDTLHSFGVDAKVINICRGPAVTRYELSPNAGVKISRITNLADDIALNLAAPAVRIEAPIPGKAAIGIEVPNANTATTYIRSIISSPEFKDAKSSISVALGKDIAGKTIVTDLAKMPHLLIAGATGSGKSVCINSIIISLLYKASPEEVKLLLVDPKVVELGIYNGIPHLLIPVVTDPKKAAGALNWAVSEMLKRYQLFAENACRDFASYNEKLKAEGRPKLPQIVIIIDELADLMMASPAEVEDSICRLAQMARAAGMHIVIATQRPSVDVITGVIKANIPSRIAFAVSSQVDSRIILDASGAEKLLGRGDMLYLPIGMSKPLRIQGCFVNDREVESVVTYLKENSTADYDDSIVEHIETNAKESTEAAEDDGDNDVMLPDAIECVIEAGQASTSLLQRRLKLGYARAARIIDEMESRGIVGPFEGSKPRKVLISRQQWQEMLLNKKDEA